MSKSEIKKYYGKKGPTGYNDIIPDFHRARYDGVVYILVTMVTTAVGG